MLSICSNCFQLQRQSVWKQFLRYTKYAKHKNIDPKQEESLPTFVFAKKITKKVPRLYAMGNVPLGALGIPVLYERFFNENRGKKMPRPYTLIPFTNEHKVKAFACGYEFSVFIVDHPTHVCFGTGLCVDSQIGSHHGKNKKEEEFEEYLSSPRPISFPFKEDTKATHVACGRAHTLINTDTEGVWTVGNNGYGQCGRRVIEDEVYSRGACYHRVAELGGGSEVEELVCGLDTSFVLLKNGTVYSCGWSADGQCGQETFENVDTFTAIAGDLKGEHVIKIATSGDCVLALTSNGEVFGWGNSEYRQLGNVTDEMQCSVPRRLSLNLGKIIDIGVSGTSCFVVTEAGELWSWGYGILGRGPSETFSELPKMIPNPLLGRTVLNPDSKVTKIFCGLTMAAAINTSGTLFTWGRNRCGNLGLGHHKPQPFPLRVSIAGYIRRVSCGINHSIVLSESL